MDGRTVADIAEAQLKQAVIDKARRIIVALDSSKFGTTDFVMICGLDRIGMIITDEATSDVAAWCAANQATLNIAGPLDLRRGPRARPRSRRGGALD